jgi:hypothetical protein
MKPGRSTPAAPNHVDRGVMRIDMEPLLAAERAKCERVANELERAKQTLEAFRTHWRPAFSRWLHAKFGERITQARDLAAKAAELARLVTSVETEAYLSNCSEKAAYARIESIREGAAKIDEMRSKLRHEEPSPEQNESEEGTAGKGDDELPPEVEEFLKMGFEQMFGRNRFSPKEHARMFESFKQSFREEVLGAKRKGESEKRHQREERRKSRAERAAASRSSPPESSDDLRRKQLYRDLARKLHPDANRELTAQEQDLWHEVRAAYESKNLEALETLAAMVESGEAGYLNVRSVSRLRAILLDTQRKLRATQKAVREAKKDPSWKFDEIESDPQRIKALGKKIAQDLSEDIRSFTAEISHYERRIERWRAASGGRKKRSSRAGEGADQGDLPL